MQSKSHSSHIYSGCNSVLVTAGETIKSNDNMHIFYEVKLTDRVRARARNRIVHVRAVVKNVCVCTKHVSPLMWDARGGGKCVRTFLA